MKQKPVCIDFQGRWERFDEDLVHVFLSLVSPYIVVRIQFMVKDRRWPFLLKIVNVGLILSYLI